MPKLAMIFGRPHHTKAAQRKAVADAGITNVFEVGKELDNCAEIERFVVKGDELYMHGLQVVGESRPIMRENLAMLARKQIVIVDLDIGVTYSAGETAAAASLAAADRFYNREARAPSPKQSRKWGAEGGKKSAELMTKPLTLKHRDMWFNTKRYLTNKEAAEAIAADLGQPVSIETIRRKWGSAGRPAGWMAGRAKKRETGE
jgi:hypothetical protein